MKKLFFGLLIILLVNGCNDSAKEYRSSTPNILIIFTDDQGYADPGCYGSETNRTPNLDQLAKEGTRFTSFYAQPVCGPSRSALLTGRYPIRSKGWGMPAEETTFGELLLGAGYQTACIGKWDVSNRAAISERMPNAQGFEYYFGPLGANDGGKVRFHENNTLVDSTNDMGSLTRLYTDKAIDFLENRREKDKPFVLYLAHTMMHTIIDASPEFKGKSKGNLYGDVVEEFDYETGRLLEAIDQLGLRENTLVIYTTDNGPWNQPAYTNWKKGHPAGSVFWGSSGPLRNGKGSCYEGGSRVPCIIRWPGKVPENRVSDAIFATVDFMPTFSELAGFDIPDDRIIDGVPQVDLLLGKSKKGARETYYYQGNGIRKGKWKYLRAQHNVATYAADMNREEREELYNLDEDMGETRNLAEQYPEKVEELKALMKTVWDGEYVNYPIGLPSKNKVTAGPAIRLSDWERGIRLESRSDTNLFAYLWFYEWHLFDAVEKGEHTHGSADWEWSVNREQRDARFNTDWLRASLYANRRGADLVIEIKNKSDHDWPSIAALIPCFNPGNIDVTPDENPLFMDEAHIHTYFLGEDGLELIKGEYPREIHFSQESYAEVMEWDKERQDGKFVFDEKWPTSERDAHAGIMIRESSDKRYVMGIAWDSFLSAQGHNPWHCMHLSVKVGPLKQGESKYIRGKIYLFEGSKEECLTAFEEDFK